MKIISQYNHSVSSLCPSEEWNLGIGFPEVLRCVPYKVKELTLNLAEHGGTCL
jgi:hypothetical protein